MYDKIWENIESGNYEEAGRLAKDDQIKLLAAWNDNKNNVSQRIRRSQNLFQRVMSWLNKQKDARIQAAYDLGYLRGTCTALNHVLWCEDRDWQIRRLYDTRLKNIPFLNELVSIIAKEGPLSQDEFMKKSGLPDGKFMHAANTACNEGVFVVTVSGKYVVYSLTDIGRHYARIKDKLNPPAPGNPSVICGDED